MPRTVKTEHGPRIIGRGAVVVWCLQGIRLHVVSEDDSGCTLRAEGRGPETDRVITWDQLTRALAPFGPASLVKPGEE